MSTPYRAVCADNLHYMAGLKESSVSLVLTSPPYNTGKAYEDRLEWPEYLARHEAVVGECVRLLAPGGSLCWQVGHSVRKGEVIPLDCLLYPVFKRFDLTLRNRIVWTFGHGLHCTRRFSGRHETVLWFTKGEGYRFDLDPVRVPQKYPGKRHYKGPKKGQLSGDPRGKNPGDVWDIPNVKHNHPEKTSHPCQFPVALAERLVLSLTRPGDVVFDPYMGAGSALVAAVRHDRIGFGCDTDPHYVETTVRRLEAMTGGERLRIAA